jgi:prevent-host-death family protein
MQAISNSSAWRLQDAKAQFSALVDSALRGVPQHVTRRGKQAVVVLSEQDFEALQRSAANAASNTAKPLSLIDHLLAMPKMSKEAAQTIETEAITERTERLEVQPRTIDF